MARGYKTAGAGGLFFNDDIEKNRENTISAQLNKLIAEVAEIKTALAAHTHGGITAGAASTAVPATITYTNPEADYIG